MMLRRHGNSILYSGIALAAVACLAGLVASNPLPEKTLTDLGCLGGGSYEDCPRFWRFGGGDGFVGQRAYDPNTKIMCSPSCTARDGTPDKKCGLIMVLHGIDSSPSDMVSITQQYRMLSLV